jgi:hypothetical protein
MKYVVQSRKATPLFLGLLLVMILCLVPAVMAPGPASAQTTVYLPIVFRSWPPVPATPTLLPIDDGDGNYAVSWTAAARADDYELQEKYQTQDWFSAYLGTGTQVDLSNRPAGQYTYRCRATNSWGEGSWSNEVTVTVQGTPPGTVSQPSCTHVSAGGKAVVRVINDCPYVLYLDFTGTQPVTMELPKCDVCSTYSYIGPIFCPTSNRPQQDQQLDPGDYRVFVTVKDPSVRPYTGQWALEGDCRYFMCFYILRSSPPEGQARTRLVLGPCN